VKELAWKASMWVTASWVQDHSLQEKMLLKGAFFIFMTNYICGLSKKNQIEGTI
jgi:hypothetical protein